jgi:hypothetical protein
MRDRPMLFTRELQASKQPLPLCSTGLGKCVPGIAWARELLPFFKGHRGALVSLDNVLADLLSRLQDRLTAEHSNAAEERIHCDVRRLRSEVVESSVSDSR